MPQVTVKYKCGQQVTCHGIFGQITAIFIRGKGRTYEFSYVNTDGDPTSITAEECELDSAPNDKIGFHTK